MKSLGYLIQSLKNSMAQLAMKKCADHFYKDLFEYSKDRLGAVKLDRLPALFPELNFSHCLTSEEAELVLCTAYSEYKAQGFWMRLWLRATTPISTYRDLYQLITLRTLRSKFEAIIDSDFDNDSSHSLFTVLVAGVNAYLSSLLPKKISFWGGFFQKQTTQTLTQQLKHFEKETYTMLEKNTTDEYVNLLQKIALNERDNIDEAIDTWFVTRAGPLLDLMEHCEDKYKKKYASLLTTLKYRQRFLLNAVLIENEQQVVEIDINKDENQFIDAKFDFLNGTLINLEAGLSVQLGSIERIHYPNTYHVYQNFLNQWKVQFYTNGDSPGKSIALSDIEGLDDLLNRQQLNFPKAIEQVIAQFHQEARAKSRLNPAVVLHAVNNASPELLANYLIKKYSNQLERILLTSPDENEQLLKAGVRQLLVYSEYIANKKDPVLLLHQRLKQEALNNCTRYKALINGCNKQFKKISISSISEQLFCAEPIIEMAPHHHALNEQHTLINESQDFTNLPLVAQNELNDRLMMQRKLLKTLSKILTKITSPAFFDKVEDALNERGDTPWVGRIEADFEQAYSYILAHQPMVDESVIHHLNETGTACIYRFIINSKHTHSDLRCIYKVIKDTQEKMVHKIQEQNRFLVRLPPEQQSKVVPGLLVANTLYYLDELPRTIGQLRLEFKAALKSTVDDNDELLAYFQALTQALIYQIEALLWGVTETDNKNTWDLIHGTIKEIDTHYKSIALLCHPDKAQQINAHQRMATLNSLRNEALTCLQRYLNDIETLPENPMPLPDWIATTRRNLASTYAIIYLLKRRSINTEQQFKQLEITVNKQEEEFNKSNDKINNSIIERRKLIEQQEEDFKNATEQMKEDFSTKIEQMKEQMYFEAQHQRQLAQQMKNDLQNLFAQCKQQITTEPNYFRESPHSFFNSIYINRCSVSQEEDVEPLQLEVGAQGDKDFNGPNFS